MSLLVIQLPPRERLQARGAAADAAPAARLPAEWPYVYSVDGHQATQQGRAPAALLPRADQRVLVLSEAELSWHRIEVPRAPPARLRSALLGVMEEALLEDDEALHFALGPGAVGGQPGWVAVTQRSWLAGALAALEAAGVPIDRALPASQPGGAARGHFFVADADGQPAPWLAFAGPDQAVCVPLAGGLARALLAAPSAGGEPVRWSSTPAAAVAAEAWLGAPVALMSDAERLLEAAQGSANLRQFELAPRRRGRRALELAAQRLFSAEWRPVRVGLAALALINLVGLNAYAWHEQRVLADKRAAMTALLRSTYPDVRAVLDAPLQMARETERLRAAAGRAGPGDLERLLGAAAGAWPEGQGPVQSLRFEPGRLTLAAAGWDEAQFSQFRERLQPLGLAVERAEGRITITRSDTPSDTAAPA
ncbi:MAG: general secretion pathway protein GspL [Burkholderiales bacterium]|nr:general secretion pathway protein GspL [Burkholderiales bacterium]